MSRREDSKFAWKYYERICLKYKQKYFGWYFLINVKNGTYSIGRNFKRANRIYFKQYELPQEGISFVGILIGVTRR